MPKKVEIEEVVTDAGEKAEELTEKAVEKVKEAGKSVAGLLRRVFLASIGAAVVAEEENLPLPDSSLDLFVSILTLHGVNDFVGALAQARRALKPDGLFIGAFFAEDTLKSLKTALLGAESETTGGASPRIGPFATVQSIGAALSRAGFALPVVDIDRVSVKYSSAAALVSDLRAMGETQALADRPKPLNREIVARAHAMFEANGGVEQFNIAYATGWAPHESQQRPMKPGSAKTSLQSAIDRQLLNDG